MKLARSRRALDELPARAFAFLKGAGTRADVRQALARAGYDERMHADGWEMLRAVVDRPLKTSSFPTTTEAARELRAFFGRPWRRARASLRSDLAKVGAKLFAPVPRRDSERVLRVTKLLDAIDTVPELRARLVTDGGLTDDVRARLRILVNTLLGLAEGLDSVSQPPAPAAELRQLRTWLGLAIGMARQAITRRDQLIALGVARRRSPGQRD
jgi:hypothetical protein